MLQNSFASSFRDPAGQLLQMEGRIFRLVQAVATQDVEQFLSSHRFVELSESGHLVQTSVLDLDKTKILLRDRGIGLLDESEFGMALEHEKIPFVSFPAEWPPEMLYVAGLLTIELAEASLHEEFGLKDATPYNVLFRGAEPVFIDILSFERRNPYNPTWLAYGQFVRTFLLPLIVNKHFSLSMDKFFLSSRDGIEPEEVYHIASPLRRLVPPFLNLVSIPVWLGKQIKSDETSIYKQKLLTDSEKATFILKSLFKRLKKQLKRLQPTGRQSSAWSDYLAVNNNYTDEHFETKCTFIESVLAEHRPKNVLDVGCNTGHFSAIAARCGASVVAIDYDPVVVGEVWRKARLGNLDILPLVVNLTRPTPAMGWKNAETPSFLERATGSFDGVLMLAVIHHMLVTERIPLTEIISQSAQLTTDLLIIEYVSPDDSMFKRITRGAELLYTYLSKELFEKQCQYYFDILESQHLEGTHRWLYVMRKKELV